MTKTANIKTHTQKTAAMSSIVCPDGCECNTASEIPAQQLFNRKIVFLKKSFMAGALKFMVDEKGQKTSVLVPIKTWEKINEDYNRLQNKLKFLVGLKEALNEVKSAKKSGKKLQTLKEFLRESNS